MRTRAGLTLALALTAATIGVLQAQERVDQDVLWKIRQEGTTKSRVMEIVRVFTDVYGPRLTGSPNLKAAGEWAVQQMQSWGMKNGRLEPWDWGRPGWTNERLSVHLVSPVKDALVAEALAWTPSTKGTARAAAVPITLPQRVTRDEFQMYLDSIRSQVQGRIVLVNPPQQVRVSFNPVALRTEDAAVMTQLNAAPAPAQPPAAPQPQPQPQAPPAQNAPQPTAPPARPLTNGQMQEQLDQFFVSAGVLVRVNDAGRDHGQIRAFDNATHDITKAVPTLVMRNEDYGRIWRLLADKRPVQLEVEIVNESHPEGRTAYNTIAEIPGTDRADEVVMMGGHLDSWHAATGATDNAVGCAVMMEAARILSAIGVRPRRTIRVALWSGEEQGLLGSRAYVREHFGTAENPKPAFAKFGGYLNMDNGTGRPRGITVFGPAAAATILREALAGFTDLGFLGATTTRSRATGGSDHTRFNEAGLPGMSFMQDPVQYQTYTWHTNLDTYERIVEDDVKKAAIVAAATMYHLASRDELLPRFSAAELPPGPRGAN